jgi:FkbM family methyltransferase
MYLKALSTLLREKLRPVVHPTIYRQSRELFEERKRFYSSFLKPGDLVFDVGANLGNRIEVFLGLKTKAVAFEPQMYCYLFLKMKYGKTITLVNSAMGSKKDKLVMYINPGSSTISSLSQEWISKVRTNRFKGQQWNKTQEVEVNTLDAMITSYGKPAFIKIDVEGFEVEVLKGLSTPVSMICFEYTIPEQTENVFQCMHKIHALSASYRYNFSLEETNRFSFDDWKTYEEIIALLSSGIDVFQAFGDIYARLEQR